MAESEVEQPYNHTQRITRRSLIVLVFFVLTVLVVPILFGRTPEVKEFDSSLVEEFRASKAEVVFLGNSLLDTRIDPERVTDLSGLATVSMAIDGTAPGVWFLQLENIIAESQVPAERIFVFFHDDLITRPIFFTGVEDQGLVESLTKSSGEIEQLPRKNDSFSAQIARAFSNVYPLSNTNQRRSKSPISSIGAAVVGIDNSTLESHSDEFFLPVNFRDRGSLIQQPKFHGDFDKIIDDSFLPLMIDSATRIGTELIFVRVAARPNDDGSPNEPEALKRYSDDLADFLGDRGVALIDMTEHVETGVIDATTYYDGYHLKHRFRDHYTDLFVDWMLNEFEDDIGFGAER